MSLRKGILDEDLSLSELQLELGSWISDESDLDPGMTRLKSVPDPIRDSEISTPSRVKCLLH